MALLCYWYAGNGCLYEWLLSFLFLHDLWVVKLKRFLRHFVFWLVFYVISLYNELYLSPSFSSHPSVKLFIQVGISVFSLFIIKIIVVYFILLKLLPVWEMEKHRMFYYLKIVAVIVTGTVLMRLTTQLFIWKILFNEIHPLIEPAQQLARFFYSLFDLMLIAGIALVIKLFRMRLIAIEKEKMLVREKLTAQVKHLQSQMNPHFLFNSLNSIYALSRKNPGQTQEVIIRLSKILRYMLYEIKELKTIRDELSILREYIAMQKIRYEDHVRIHIKCTDEAEQMQIPPLILLPLLENTFKHGDTEQGVTNMTIWAEGAVIKVQVENKIGESNSLEQGEGIGLGNITRQLELLYSNFSFQHNKRDGWFIVNLEIDSKSYAAT